MRLIEYNRIAVVDYARKWWNKRNPDFYDFTDIGGDCTNFASQCLYAGCSVMNYTPDVGWYYVSSANRSASWAGVEYFYNFLTQNNLVGIGNSSGPFGVLTDLSAVDVGDFIQLADESGDYYHTLIVTGFTPRSTLVTAHSRDAFDRELSDYRYYSLRAIHILGAREY